MTARLGDLARMLDEVDDLFAVHLPEHTEWLQSFPTTGPLSAEAMSRWVDTLFAEAAILLRRDLLPDLADAGTTIRPVVNLDEAQRAWLHQHFTRSIYPLLTPLAVDPGRPFPFISSESLNLLVELRKPEAQRIGTPSLLARVKIPTSCPLLIPVPARPSAHTNGKELTGTAVHVCAADVVRFFVHHLFPGMPVRRVYLFRVVRGDHELPGVTQLDKFRPRRDGSRPAVRMDVERRMDADVLAWLAEHLRLPAYAVARHDGLAEWACLPQAVASNLSPRH